MKAILISAHMQNCENISINCVEYHSTLCNTNIGICHNPLHATVIQINRRSLLRASETEEVVEKIHQNLYENLEDWLFPTMPVRFELIG